MNKPESIPELCAKLSREVVAFFDEVAAIRGYAVAKRLEAEFLATFVTGGIVRALRTSRAKQVGIISSEVLHQDFSEHKTVVQIAIASGFQAAVSNLVGKPVEYYCLVKTVPEMKNKLVN